jgi:hypothetical protein
MPRESRKGISRADAYWLVSLWLERAEDELLMGIRTQEVYGCGSSLFEGTSVAYFHAARMLAAQCDGRVFDADTWRWKLWRDWTIRASRGEESGAAAVLP